MRPLCWLSTNEFLKRYKSQEESLITIYGTQSILISKKCDICLTNIQKIKLNKKLSAQLT